MSDSPPGDPATWEGWFSATTEPTPDALPWTAEITSLPPVVPDPFPQEESPFPPQGSPFPPPEPSRGDAGRLRRWISRPLARVRRWPRPDRVTYVLASLLVVVGVVAAVLYELRPDADATARSACTHGITSTGAVVHAATLRSVPGSGGRWTVGVQATDGSGTRQWVCHVLWDGSHATVVTAVPAAS